MSELNPIMVKSFEDAIVAGLREEGITSVQLVRGAGMVRYSPEDFATWLRGGLLGYTNKEVDETLDRLVREGRVQMRTNPLTGENEFKLPGDSW